MGDYSAICELRDRAPRGKGCTALTVSPRYCALLHARGRCNTVDVDALVDPAVSGYIGAVSQYKGGFVPASGGTGPITYVDWRVPLVAGTAYSTDPAAAASLLVDQATAATKSITHNFALLNAATGQMAAKVPKGIPADVIWSWAKLQTNLGPAFVVEYSEDSTTGADGTWAQDATGYLGALGNDRQVAFVSKARVDASASGVWIRTRFLSNSTGITLNHRFTMKQKPASGLFPSIGIAGVSLDAVPYVGAVSFEAAWRALYPNSDPLVLDAAVPGQTSAQIDTTLTTAAPILARGCSFALTGSLFTNDCTNQRPYAGGQAAALLASGTSIYNKLISRGLIVISPDTIYGTYELTGSPVTPATQSAGQLPYDKNIHWPLILSLVADSWNTTYNMPAIAYYLWQLENYWELASDGVHLVADSGVASLNWRADQVVNRAMLGTFKQHYSEIIMAAAVADPTGASPTAAVTKKQAAANMLLAMPASAGKTVLQATYNSIP